MALEQDLLAIDRNFWTGGPEAYLTHCDDQCLVVFSEMAKVMSKEDIAKTAEAGRWGDINLAPKGFMQLSDQSAIVSYECSAKRKDGQPYRALISSGYVRRADGWKMAFHQQTAVS
jgi:ketosteroid isomerase-like protein